MAAATFYVTWNVGWLAFGHVPPSILRRLAGLPVPTTGMTRGLLAAWHGAWPDAFLWNPLAVPIAGLCLASAIVVVRACLCRERPALPAVLARAWAVVLVAAWIV